ncbi:hypothetical protein F5876DRAFT_71687 [Lentinula aff. lateritia]|uniref:Uncharacterized protein n=1 Tax=Lentinula aff. lateritia TaxID=2804960 RepID=A0ACC1UFH8_9AGAR|nr:hypothetical protein F5876DRAFT_71687 [Lentinula aff. lateritia]
MTTSRTQTTTTNSSTAGPSRLRPVPPPPIDLTAQEEEGLEDEDEDEDEIIQRAQARVERVRARKAAEAAKKVAEEKAARAAAEKKKRAQEAQEQAQRVRQQEEEVEERRRLLAAAATARSQRGTSPSEVSVSPRRPVVEISKFKGKGKGKAKAQPVDEDPDDGDDEREPCERCRTKKLSCQMQAGKRSSIICKPCHDAKVRCSYSGRPSTVKREGGSNPTGERLAVLESQVAQLLADNRQLHDGQVKANTYHHHFNRKLDWLITDAARRRRTPPELPEAGPSGLSRKRRRVMDSDKEEEHQREQELEEDGEGEEEEMVEKETAPTAAQSEKGKERAEE